MEQCSYIAASRVGRSGHLLTGSMDSLAFAQPTRVADIMYITAQARTALPVCGVAVRARAWAGVLPLQDVGPCDAATSNHCICRALFQVVFSQVFRVLRVQGYDAQVTGIFGSSMEVMISVCGETPAEGASVFHCGDAYATVVAVDPEGQPAEVPFELVPSSPDDIRRCMGVAARCAASLC